MFEKSEKYRTTHKGRFLPLPVVFGGIQIVVVYETYKHRTVYEKYVESLYHKVGYI